MRAPDFPAQFAWLNVEKPLRLADLRGRVVLLEFWTMGCVNCLHVQPDLAWLEAHFGAALVIVGVHTAKFAEEQHPEAVRQAVQQLGITHPVVIDQNRKLWEGYAVRAWPTFVLVDPKSYVVGQVSGEGRRAVLAKAIGRLLAGQPPTAPLPGLVREAAPLTPLAQPGKVATSGDQLVIADSGHHRLVICRPDGSEPVTIGSGEAGWQDGSFDTAAFFDPQGLAPRGADQIVVCDRGNHRLRLVDLNTRTVHTLAGNGLQAAAASFPGGAAVETPLNSPWDAVWVGDRLLVAMAGAHQIWQYDPATEQIGWFAGNGAESCLDGPAAQSAFAQPSGISSDGRTLFVADAESSSVRSVAIATGQVGFICGSGDLFGFGDRDGVGEAVRLQHPLGLHWDGQVLWLADTYNHVIKRIDPSIGLCERHTDASFSRPGGLWSHNGLLYVADTGNNAIRVFDRLRNEVRTLTIAGLCPPGVCIVDDASV